MNFHFSISFAFEMRKYPLFNSIVYVFCTLKNYGINYSYYYYYDCHIIFMIGKQYYNNISKTCMPPNNSC